MTNLPAFECRHQANDLALKSEPFGGRTAEILGAEAFAEAKREITAWPGYAPPPLLPLSGLASALGLGAIHYKDEGQRFGLKSFKALGGAYAVQRVLPQALKTQLGAAAISLDDINQPRYPDLVDTMPVVTATDGNHGRSVAWGAQRFGCQCVIYMHENVSQARQQAVEA